MNQTRERYLVVASIASFVVLYVLAIDKSFQACVAKIGPWQTCVHLMGR